MVTIAIEDTLIARPKVQQHALMIRDRASFEGVVCSDALAAIAAVVTSEEPITTSGLLDH